MDVRSYASRLRKRRSRNSSKDFRFSTFEYCPACTSHRYLPRSTKRISFPVSFRFSHARILVDLCGMRPFAIELRRHGQILPLKMDSCFPVN